MFSDADEAIASEAGMTVAEIFARFGEAHFRKLERRIVADLVEGPPRVIAAGGGAFLDPRLRRLILERAVAIWLDAEPAALAERVGRGDGRPLLAGEAPRAALARLAERRARAYRQAHLAVRSDGASPDEVAERIAAALERAR